jgi:tetratricopeptide (TPR) repeat protein
VILTDDEVRRIAGTPEGSLEEVPFAVLLYALARAGRTVGLEITRQPLVKEIVIEGGIPVACSSNLVHETLSRFMQSTGLLDDAKANELFAESCAKGVRFGDVLIEKGVISAEELLKVLQQNLARKLLDVFSWQHGSYRMTGTPLDVDSTLKVNVPQLIVLGVSRFATQEQVDGSMAPFIGQPLALHPFPFFSLNEIRMSPLQRSLIDAVEQRPMRIDELATATGVPFEELTRTVYALTLIGAMLPAQRLSEEKPSALTAPPKGTVASEARPAQTEVAVSEERRDELMQMVLNFRRKDAFELLGLDPNDFEQGFHDRFLEFAERFAPWSYGTELTADARRVFLAGARAYGDLVDPDRRQILLDRRQARRQPKPAAHDPDAFRIETDLLDPEVQFRKGLRLKAAGNHQEAIAQLAYASDMDPHNGSYRAELAYCRYLCDPEAGGPPALEALKEALRIDPRSGLALFYRGEVLRGMGRLDEAGEAYRESIKPMAPDRRPIEALHDLQRERT